MRKSVEIIVYDKGQKREVEIVRDVYTLREMIRFMKDKTHCLFEIQTIDSVFVYNEETMSQLMHEYGHCFFWDRRVVMIND